jgi:murein DD-endopeptidase MepM/ murein hydrolase activator NlpD
MSKQLFQPVKPFYLHQKFAENKACVDIETGSKVITCDGNNPPEGYRSLYGPKGHTGIDIAAYHGQPVYCAQDGTIYMIDTQPKSGLDVRVESTVNGRRFRHIYEHLLGYRPREGDTIKCGDLVGWADNTGYSSGDHLHFQVEEFINGKWVPIDPLSVMEDVFALEFAGLWRQVQDLIARVAEFIAEKTGR